MNRRKGFTLMEMSIVLLLVAIIGSMVVSFSVMMNKRVKANQFKLNIIQETDNIETMLESWIDDKLVLGAEFIASDGVLTANASGHTHTAKIEGNKFKLLLDGSATNYLELEAITKLNFSLEQKGEKILFICSVFYTLNEIEQSYVFTINSRVGQTLNGEGV